MSDYNPFDWQGTPSIFAPPVATKLQLQERARMQRKRAIAAATRVNPESHIAYTNRNAADKTNAIRNSTP